MPRIELGFDRSGSTECRESARLSDPFNSRVFRGGSKSAGIGDSFVLSWHTVSVSLHGEAVLKSVSGRMISGSVSGLVTADVATSLALLEILAARYSAGRYKHSGRFDIRINDTLADIKQQSYRKRVTYLPAGDSILPEHLTVKEALVFHARLANVGTRSVSKIISNMKLQLKERVLISDLSVAERARARVAIALVGRPAALLLDSPLNGLDVYEAFQTVSVLKRVANDLNIAVLISANQPSSEVLFGLDEVTFVMKGSIVFSGMPGHVVPYFMQLGYNCPPSYSPSDFLLFLFEVVLVEEEDRLISAWNWHVGNQLLADVDSTVREDVSTPVGAGEWDTWVQGGNTPCPLKPKPSLAVGFWVQFSILYQRNVLMFFRSFDRFLMRACILGLLTLLVALVMYKVASDGRLQLDDPSTVDLDGVMNNYYGAITFMIIIAMSGHLEAITVSLPATRTLFLAEDTMGSRLYGIFAFVLSQLCVELPITFLLCTFQLCLAYWTVGFGGSFDEWLAVLFLAAVSTSSVGWLISCWSQSALTAVQFIPMVILPQILFSGLLVDFDLIPYWMTWISLISYLKYCVNLAFLVEFDMYMNMSPISQPVESLASQKGIYESQWAYDIIFVVVLSILSRLGAILALSYYRSKGQWAVKDWLRDNIA